MSQEFNDFEVQVDISDVNAWDGSTRPLLPVGDYALTVVNVKQKNGQKGSMMEVEFEVADEGEHKGQKVWCNYQLQGKGLGRTKQFAIACGAPLDTIRASHYIGCTIAASIVHNEGQPQVNQAGEQLPARTFANVWNERPLAQPAVAQPVTQQPPITKTVKPTNGAVRRA